MTSLYDPKAVLDNLVIGLKIDLEAFKKGEMMGMQESVQGEFNTERILKTIETLKIEHALPPRHSDHLKKEPRMAKYMTKDLFPILNQFSYMTINGDDVESIAPRGDDGTWTVKPDSDAGRSIIPNQEVEIPDNDLVGEIKMVDDEGEEVAIECARHVGITLADIVELAPKTPAGPFDHMLRSLQNQG